MCSARFLLLELLGVYFSAHAFDINEHRIKGIMVAVYTPMKPGAFELNLDVIPAYASLMKHRNITNVMPAGSNGESLSLTVAERKALAEAWGKVASKNGLKIYMHIGSESLIDTRELMLHASQTQGIAGAVCMTPVYFRPTAETLHDFLASVAGVAPEFPFWYYHFPDETLVLPGQAHTLLEMVDKSGKIPNMMGIKFTDYNLMDFSLCTQLGTGKYNMLYGRDEQALPALELGAEAAVSSTVNYAPSLREAVRLYKLGQKKAAYEQQALNTKLCSMFGAYESKAKNVQKNILKMVGMDAGPSRLPKRDLTSSEFVELKAELLRLGYIDHPLGSNGAMLTMAV